jgi:hypothetical protein
MRRTINRRNGVMFAAKGKVIRDFISCNHNIIGDAIQYETTYKYIHLWKSDVTK